MTSPSTVRHPDGDEPPAGTPAPTASAATLRTDRWSTVVALGVAAVLGILAVLGLAPPAAQGTGAPAEAFSAARAERHVDRVAQRPHPSGSPEAARVRAYIAGTARSLGADVTLETGRVVRPPEAGRAVSAAEVTNVVARVAGRAPGHGGKPLLVVSHYDSVPTGPGAADDGAAVAAMLETMRALKAGGGVREDVVFLFTDAEELGSLGARGFVRQHPVKDFSVVLNWEARGTGGPVMFFETSTGNGPLVSALADGGVRPVANSLAYEVYRRMANETDFSVFKDAGAAGFNAAFLSGFRDYHSPRDDAARLDPDSLQHQGATMLGLVRALGDHDPGRARGADAVYFDLFSRVLVHYPAGWAVGLAVVTVLAFAGLVVWGTARRALRPADLLVVAATGVACVVLTAVLGFGLWFALTAIRPELADPGLPEPYGSAFLVAGFLVLTLGPVLGAARVLRGRGATARLAGCLLLCAVLLVATTAVVPGAGYLAQWPLLAGLPALWWSCRRAAGAPAARPGAVAVTVVLDVLPSATVAVLFAPLVASLLIALGTSLAAVAMAVACTGGLLLVPSLARVPRPGATGAVAAVVALGLAVVGVWRSDYSAHRPQPDSLVYVRDLDRGTARWFSTGRHPDGWTRKALGGASSSGRVPGAYLGQGRTEALSAKAPRVDLAPPAVRLLADSAAGDVRTVRFRVTSRRDAWMLRIRLPLAGLRGCEIAGTRLTAGELSGSRASDGSVAFEYTGGGADGAELSCDVRAGTRLRVDAADRTAGLPRGVAALVGPRTKDTTVAPFGFGVTDTSVARRTTTL
ncbi:M20/M25/M40 family metallo-hydrolase [Streptomyces naphthomycinicus]|uniref:M20/M25/M40 family metallo-hydrolase n=1 Tax=Streptomyces naphthomycinicus TaxID=2872625 RepID=UPI0021F1350E|nr:M20/M25/M40 family metallo-hydrolase [Streptomyces sp. TML10]